MIIIKGQFNISITELNTILDDKIIIIIFYNSDPFEGQILAFLEARISKLV